MHRLLCIAILGVCSCMSCLVEGTLIDTPDGPRPVEELSVGDRVLCRGPGGQIVAGRVTAHTERRVRRSLLLTFANGNQLQVTPSHPLLSERGWQRAGTLTAGSAVASRSGPVLIRHVELRRERVKVYDLTVSPHANFFAEGVLVHNKSYFSPDLSGRWVGLGAGGSFYALELRGDGTGVCGWPGREGELRVRSVLKWWTVRGQTVRIKFAGDASAPPIRVEGEILEDALRFARFLDDRTGRTPVTFVRERRWSEMRRRVGRELERRRRDEQAGP